MECKELAISSIRDMASFELLCNSYYRLCCELFVSLTIIPKSAKESRMGGMKDLLIIMKMKFWF